MHVYNSNQNQILMKSQSLKADKIVIFHLETIQYLINSNQFHLFQEREFKSILNQCPQYQHLVKVFTFDGPIDRSTIEDISQQINDSLVKYPMDRFQAECLWRKFFSRIVIGCVMENNRVEGEFYLKKLLEIINSIKDIQEVIFSFFGFTSLVALRCYKIDSNCQYKYSSTTKLLFYYILSQIKTKQFNWLYGKCVQIIHNELDHTSSKKTLISKINQQIKENRNHLFLKKVIKSLYDCQKQFRGMDTLNIFEPSDQLHNIIRSYIRNKWNVQITNAQDFNKIKHKNTNLIKIMKIILLSKPRMIHQSVFKTNFIKKMELFQSQIMQVLTKTQKLQAYNEMCMRKGSGEIDKFNKCRQGMFLRKCNFNNEDIKNSFVYLGKDGIYWGHKKSECSLKFGWQKIRGILYGAISANFMNYNIQNRQLCFSLVLKDRTIDFVCESREQVHTWLKGVAYAMNQYKQEDKVKKQNNNCSKNKILALKGLILWSQLFIKLKKQGKPWQLKGFGLYAHSIRMLKSSK